MQRLFMRIGNGFVAALLRSPLHRVLSGDVVLITVTGRRSGRRYTTPVQYVGRGDEVYIVSRRGRTWWRNVALEGGAAISLRLRGATREATAEVLEGSAARDALPLFEGSSLARAAAREDAVIVRARLQP